MSAVETRCDDCIQIGCECPRGYGTYRLTCIKCGQRVALSRPECVEKPVEAEPCPTCGRITLELDDGDQD